jgi:hypothetical protein
MAPRKRGRGAVSFLSRGSGRITGPPRNITIVFNQKSRTKYIPEAVMQNRIAQASRHLFNEFSSSHLPQQVAGIDRANLSNFAQPHEELLRAPVLEEEYESEEVEEKSRNRQKKSSRKRKPDSEDSEEETEPKKRKMSAKKMAKKVYASAAKKKVRFQESDSSSETESSNSD